MVKSASASTVSHFATAHFHVEQIAAGLIPGTGSVAHLRDNLAAESASLDGEALRDLDSVGA